MRRELFLTQSEKLGLCLGLVLVQCAFVLVYLYLCICTCIFVLVYLYMCIFELTRDCFSLRVRGKGCVWGCPRLSFPLLATEHSSTLVTVSTGGSAPYLYLCIFVFLIVAITLGRVMPCLCLGEYCGIILGIICTEHENQRLPIVHFNFPTQSLPVMNYFQQM